MLYNIEMYILVYKSSLETKFYNQHIGIHQLIDECFVRIVATRKEYVHLLASVSSFTRAIVCCVEKNIQIGLQWGIW